MKRFTPPAEGPPELPEGNEELPFDKKVYAFALKKGNYITSVEMLHFGGPTCSCFDIYRLYVSLPTFICKRYHSVSNSGGATKRRNARSLRFQESGQRGLPRHVW